MPVHLSFDCDGTILQSMGMWLRIQPALLKTYGVDTVADDFAEFESLSVMGECEDTIASGVLVKTRKRSTTVFGHACARYSEEVSVREGVADFLKSAYDAGIPMAIATSTPCRVGSNRS